MKIKTSNHNIFITQLSKMNKSELLEKCVVLGITKCKSKTKAQLLELIEKATTATTEQSSDNPAQPMANTLTVIKIAKNLETTSHLKPLVKWSGGKSDEIKQFEQYFPKEYNTYIEPFIGGGSVYFYLSPEKAVISDLHKELIDLYQCIGEGYTPEIYAFMQAHPNTEETYYNIRDRMEINTKLDNAKRFYYQRKTCFRGMLRYNKDGKFNIPFGRYATINYSDLQTPEYETLLKRTEVLNKGFEYVFEHYNHDDNFMFLDPPYDSEFTDYGYCQFGKEEQKKLATMFKETKIKCLMIIGKTPFIEELYKEYIVGEYDKKYKFKLYGGRVGDEINTKHLIIKNY
jgi:DNA adenine methylase